MRDKHLSPVIPIQKLAPSFISDSELLLRRRSQNDVNFFEQRDIITTTTKFRQTCLPYCYRIVRSLCCLQHTIFLGFIVVIRKDPILILKKEEVRQDVKHLRDFTRY